MINHNVKRSKKIPSFLLYYFIICTVESMSYIFTRYDNEHHTCITEEKYCLDDFLTTHINLLLFII